MLKRGCTALVLLVAASTARAGEADKGDAFWKGLLNKLQKVTPTRKSTSTTAVGGVRSAKNEEATDIYWKGKEKTQQIGEDEVATFGRALESRNTGNRVAALKTFEEFVHDFPNSPLRGEAVQAVERLKAEEAAQQVTTLPPGQAAK